LSLALQSLELEQEFLFLKKTKDSRLPLILKDLYESVMTNGEAFVEIDPANYLAFKLFEAPAQPRKLGEYEVPMLLYDRELTASLPWDVSLQHVLPKINGISSIKNIAQESDMDIVTVSMALRILLFYRCIIMTSVFRFNNVYQLLPDAARRLLHDSSILQDMEEFALVVPDGDQSSGIGGSETKSEKDNRGNGLYSSSLGGAQSTAGTPPVFDTNKLSAGSEACSADAPFGHCQAENGNDSSRSSDAPSRIPGILRFLFRLRPGRTVAQAMFGEHFNMHATGQDAPLRRQVNLSKHLNNIDIRRLIAIAQEKNIVQRLYEFPIRAELAREREFSSVGSDLASAAVPAPALGDTASFYPYGDPSEDDYETVVDIADMAGSEIPGAKRSLPPQTNKGSAVSKNRSSSGAPTDRSAGGERGVGRHRQTAPSKKRGASGGINKDNGSEEYLFIVDEDEPPEVASDSDRNSSTSNSDSGSGSGSGTHDSDEDERTIDPDDVSQEWRKALRNEQQQLHRQQLIDNLHGAECLDEFCCVNELAPSEITKAHHMYIAYKASPLANNEKEK
jgi:hypothetical protein